MKNLIYLTTLLISFLSLASDYQKGWGTKIKIADKSLKVGGRIQGMGELSDGNQDLFLRRLRLNTSFNFLKDHKVVYDIRNDKANKDGEKGFVIGDAYWQYKRNDLKLKFYRAKVDVSYSQTSSSKNLFNPTRAIVSDHAASFVVQNRRATNIQINGALGKLHYHAVIADGVVAEDLEDVNGNAIDSINSQKFTFGGKLRYFFFGDGSIQDTFFGKHDTFSLGAGLFHNDQIKVKNTHGLSSFSITRDLLNVDLSLSFKSFRLLTEYFEMQGDIYDLTASARSNILADSTGHYAQVEYVFGKWAPYIRYENFNRNKSISSTSLRSKTIGINYYKDLEALRFGAAFQEISYDNKLNEGDSKALTLYTMMNF